MKIMYSEITDEILIVVMQEENYLWAETRELEKLELSGSLSKKFLNRFKFKVIGEL